MRKCPSVVITEELRPYGGTVQTDIDPRSLIGRKAFDRNGTKIGTVDEVYLDDATGVPEWAAVRTGLFSRDAFVPLEPSEVVDDTLRVPFERALIKDAPDFGVGRHLSPEQELQLYHHYGLDVSLPSDIQRDFGRLANGEDTP
ncbi:PRC-barrel domain containing protein [Streptomyces vinaceus]|uniref:PRC-barrel domain containing protein n=1 Tax=Streptomyces vinaceus TaxID=1960 RepID=A0A5J6JFQ5_STRVI|nr:PRC-barrel domain containing protein [Streptomyces vinaceus]